MINKSVFIGREKELKTLHSAFEEAKTGKGKLVLVEGSAGVGKSGFVRQFLQQITHEPNTITGISECDDKENLNAYAPFKEVLIELYTTQNKDEKKSKFRNFIKDAGSSWVELIPVIGTYAKVGIETYEAYQKSFKDKQDANIESENDIFRIFENEFRRLAEDKTVVIFIDDLQWADASSLNLLFGLGKAIRGNPFKILFIGSFRPNEVKAGRNKITETGASVKVPHPFEDKLNMLRTYTKQENHIVDNTNWFQEIAIKPFTKKEFEHFINVSFPNNQFKRQFFETTYNITDGHPLFVVEILDYLVSERIIHHNDGAYFANEITLGDLPTSIDGVISEKVERLNKDLLKVLTYASVDGEDFAFQIIERILNMNDDEKVDLLIEYIEELSQTHGLLTEEADNSGLDLDLFSFSQTLVHKFVYKNMSNLKRKRLHKKVANIMKDVYGDMLETNKELKDKYNLHVQIGQGLIDGISLQMNTRASDKETTEKDDETTDLPTSQVLLDAAATEIQNAKDSYKQFAITETHSFVDKALAFLSRIDESPTEKIIHKIKALKWRNKALHFEGHYQNAFDTAVEMNKLAKDIGNEEFLAQANLSMGTSSTDLGRSEEALGFLDKAIRYYQTTNNTKSLWEAYFEAGYSNNTLTHYKEAISLLSNALDLSEKLEDRIKEGRTLCLLSKSYSLNQEVGVNSLDYLFKALTIFEEAKNQFWVGKVYDDIGMRYLQDQDETKSLEFLEKGLKIAQEQNDTVAIANRFDSISLFYYITNQPEKAVEYSKKALVMFTRLDNRTSMSRIMNSLASVYVEMEDFDNALLFLNDSLKIATDLSNQSYLSSVHFFYYNCYFTMKDNEKTIEHLLKAIEINDKMEDVSSLATNNDLAGDFYRETNNYELATEHYNEAIKYYTQLGDQDAVTRVKASISELSNTAVSTESSAGSAAPEKNIQVNNEVDNLELSIENDLVVNYEKGREFHKAKNYEDALNFYKKAMESSNLLAETDEYNKLRADIYFGMAESNKMSDNYDLAIDNYIDSYNYYLKLSEIDYNDTARVCSFLGDTYNLKEDYKKAIENHQEALESYTRVYGASSEMVAWSHYDLGGDYYWSELYEESINHYKKALEIRLNINGRDHEDVANCYMQLGDSYAQLNAAEETLSSFKNGYEIRKKLFGSNSKETDDALLKLGKVYYYSDRNAEAKECLYASLFFRKEFYGENSDEYSSVKQWMDENLN